MVRKTHQTVIMKPGKKALHQGRVLRNEPVHRSRHLLLCRWESGRVTRTHQERRRGSTFVI